MLLEINHLSPSHINTFITDRAAWFARYFRGRSFAGNVFTVRGHAVEEGIVYYLTVEQDITKAIAAGVKMYDEKIKGLKDDLAIRQSIGPMIKVLIEGTEKESGYDVAFLKYGKPNTQEKINVTLSGCSIPVHGYLDFFWPNKCIWDNKAVGKTPDSLSQDYIVQGSIYRKATGLPVSFMYGIANKTPIIKKITLSDDEYRFGLALATRAAQAIETILETPLDGGLMESLMFPNPDRGYRKEEQKELCKFLNLDVFGGND